MLNMGSLAPICKRVAEWIGMPARFVAEVGGHSTRVGAARDLAELDIDLAAIIHGSRRGCRCNMPRRLMQEGPEWREPRPPLAAARKSLARWKAARFQLNNRRKKGDHETP